MNGVKREQPFNFSYPVGYGYIIVPDGEDRNLFIQTCYRKERVSIMLDDGGGMIQNCYISKESIQQIYFPQSSNELGSAVAFIVPRYYNIPIIIGVISKSDETQILSENSFKKFVDSDNGIVSIEGKGEEGRLFINVESELNKGGEVIITIRNKNKSSKFNLNCFGDINIYSEGETTLKTLNSIDLKVVTIEDNKEVTTGELLLKDDVFKLTDKKGNKIESDTDGNINIIPTDKCNLFSGSSPLVKGDELKSQLEIMKARIDKVIEALNAGAASAATVQTYAAAVSAVLIGIVNIEDFENINSDKSFTD